MTLPLIDAFLELETIEQELAKLALVLPDDDGLPPLADLDGWVRLQGIASVVEKAYSGLERVMERVCVEVDGAPLSRVADWHAALLRRMSHAYPNRRPALLAPETVDMLQRLRAFRHRERNTYGSGLLPDRVAEHARLVIAATPLFRRDLDALARALS
jgi:hypothetical protein